MDGSFTRTRVAGTPGRDALVAAVIASLGGDAKTATAALRFARTAPGESLGVEAATIEAWLLRAGGLSQEAAERLEHAAGRILVEARLAAEARRRVA